MERTVPRPTDLARKSRSVPDERSTGPFPPVDAVEDLSHQLWTMRELLQHLVYKLEVQGLLMNTNRNRWLPFAIAEVDAVLAAVDQVEALRADASRRITSQRGLPSDIRLTDLI